jgi:hypothetical protein
MENFLAAGAAMLPSPIKILYIPYGAFSVRTFRAEFSTLRL